jgi:hypothetical protein
MKIGKMEILLHENWKNGDFTPQKLKNEGVPREKCWISAMKIGFHGENSELDNKKMWFGFRSHENLKKLWMSLLLRPQEIGCYP